MLLFPALFLWTDSWILTLPVPDLILLCCLGEPDCLLHLTKRLSEPLPASFGIKTVVFSTYVLLLGSTLKLDSDEYSVAGGKDGICWLGEL